MKVPKSKLFLIWGLVFIYLCTGAVVFTLVTIGVVDKAAPSENTTLPAGPDIASGLEAAQYFVQNNMVRDGHVDLYWLVNKSVDFPQKDSTNSEAVSYYLQWTAQAGDKEAFDEGLDFIEEKMLHPVFGYMMWRLEPNDTAIGDGTNLASDADLRAIKALLIAESKWGDERYTQFIDKLAVALEKVAITEDLMLAPYAGASGESSWTAKEVWLSYSDFTVFEELAKRRGEPWNELNNNMKWSTLGSQIHNGLYNSQLTEKREYGNAIDGGAYAINSLWIMVRCAESNDPELQESARRSLDFYKLQYTLNAEVYALYDSNGNPLSPSAEPWVYALVGRAAAALDDKEFSNSMLSELTNLQEMDPEDPLFGAIKEGGESDRRVGQFTMQESILTMQEYVARDRQ